MIDYYSKDKRDGHSYDRSKERLRCANEQYQARIAEAGLILVAGMLIVIGICVVLTLHISCDILPHLNITKKIFKFR